jgi:hypothetical protein
VEVLVSSSKQGSVYPRRATHKGTIDSICPSCFATIGTSTWEADLERMEAAHVCQPLRAQYLDEQRRRIKEKKTVVSETPRSANRRPDAIDHHGLHEVGKAG